MLLSDERFIKGDYATPDTEAFAAVHESELRSSSGGRAGPDGPTPENAGRTVTVEVNEKRFEVRVFGIGHPSASAPADRGATRAPRFKAPKRIASDSNSVLAPMHGIVAEIKVAAGDDVRDGQVVAIIEAMKMMNEVVAHRAGTVKSIE